MTVAREMVRPGSSMLSAGMVPLSSPRKAQSVSVAAAERLAAVSRGIATGSANASALKYSTPPMPITASGRIFSTVVTTCTPPAARTPALLTSVNSHTMPMASAAALAGVRTIPGMEGSR